MSAVQFFRTSYGPENRTAVCPALAFGRRKKIGARSYLSEEELAAFMLAVRASGSARDVAIFEIAVGRGLRRGEVGLILMEHLRLNVKRAWIERLKGGMAVGLEHMLLESELRALRAWIRERGDEPRPVFLSTGSAQSPESI